MLNVFDPVQLEHKPKVELHNGGWIPHSESVERVESILKTREGWIEARDFGIEPILSVHDSEYVSFLRTAHKRWQQSGRPGEAIGYTWPVVRRRQSRIERIDGLLGRYSFDAATPIEPATWRASYASAQTALTAAAAVIGDGEQHAFALCRPPGHHAGRDYLGGYCYLNNAAIAAGYARRQGRRVAILDVDYHHGNGTQDIFWDSSDVLFVSIHADPSTDYPFFWGHSDETGGQEAQATNVNLPLPRGTAFVGYSEALDRALASVRGFRPDVLILSFGADTFEDDPISHFKLRTDDFQVIGDRIGSVGLPTIIVMEGGYASVDLGRNVERFLAGIAQQS